MKHLLLALTLICALLGGCRTNETPEAQVKDVEITAKVREKLASGIGISTLPNVSVNSTNGVVTLSGAVDDAVTKTKAETLAQNVPGVLRVVDNLQVAAKPQ
jgi:hyperosmotically inducible protein